MKMLKSQAHGLKMTRLRPNAFSTGRATPSCVGEWNSTACSITTYQLCGTKQLSNTDRNVPRPNVNITCQYESQYLSRCRKQTQNLSAL